MPRAITRKGTRKGFLIFVILIISSLILPFALAQNDPGHDSLYIEEVGDSEIEGSLNITGNVSIEGGRQALINYLDIYFNGQTIASPSVPTIAGTINDLYLDAKSGGNVYINAMASSGTVFLGSTGDTVNLNITGALYFNNDRLATSSGSAADNNLYWGDKLVCNTSVSNCGWVSSTTGGGDITAVNTNDDWLLGGAETGDVSLTFNESKLNDTIDARSSSSAGGWTDLGTTINLTNPSDNVSANTLFIDNTNGRVGIGTTEPGEKLDISDGSIRLSNNWAYSGKAVGGYSQNMLWVDSSDYTTIGGTDSIGTIRVGINGGEVIRIESGNVGIGMTTPTAKLHVNGSINVTSGYDICIEGTGKCLSTVTGTAGGNLSAQGATAGYIPQFQNGSIVNNSVVFQNGTNIGIGTSTSTARLTVQQTSDENGIRVYGYDDVSSNYGMLSIDSYGQTMLTATYGMLLNSLGTIENWNDVNIGAWWSSSGVNYALKQYGYISAASAQKYVQWRVNDSTDNFELTRQDSNISYFDIQMPTIITGGNAGIGMTTPIAKLHVNGSINVTSGYDVCIEGTGKCLSTTASSGGNLSAQGATAGYIPQFQNGSILNNSVIFQNGTKIGIGITSPSVALDVSGDIQANGGSFFAGDGAAANPAYRFGTDSNTGMYLSAPNTLGFATDGASRVIIDSSGYLGINIIAPEAPFHVNTSNGITQILERSGVGKWEARITSNPTGSDNISTGSLTFLNTGSNSNADFAVRGGNSGPVDFIVDKNGNVGIGMAAPTAKLHVNGSINVTSGYDICIEGTGKCLSTTASSVGNLSAQGATAGYIPQFQNGSIVNNSVVFQNGTNIGIGTTSPSNKLTVAGSYTFGINPSKGAEGEIPAGVLLTNSGGSLTIAPSDGTVGLKTAVNYYNGSAYYSAVEVANVGSGYSDLLLMKSGGNVGIGITSPTAKLHVNSSGGTDLLALTRETSERFIVDEWGNTAIRSDGDSYSASLGVNTLGDDYKGIVVRGYSTNQSSNLQEWQNSSGTALVVVNGSGSVGIGTASPAGKLDVTLNNGGKLYATTDAVYAQPNLVIRGYQDSADQKPVGYLSFNNNYMGADIARIAGGSNGSSNRYLSLEVRNSGGTMKEQVRIDENGNVGIGTAAPGAKLDVNGTINVATTGYIYTSSRSTGAAGGTILFNSGAGANLVLAETGWSTYTFGSKTTPETSGWDTSVLSMNTQTGNVGIGMAAPTAKLHVNGSINVTSGYDICIEGTGKCLSTTASSGGNLSAQGATAGYIPQFQNGTILNNSIISQSGNTLTINGNISMPTNFWIGNSATSTGTNSLAIGYNAQATQSSTIAIGYQASATGNGRAIAIGESSQATNSRTIAIGYLTNASGTYTIAIGESNNATGNYATAIGSGSQATQSSTIAIGYLASATGTSRAIAIGESSQATNARTIAIGYLTNAIGTYAIAIGESNNATGNYTIGIGSQSKATADYATAIGYQANATLASATAIGAYTQATNISAIAIGRSSQATGQYSIALGREANALNSYATAIGYQANATSLQATAIGYQAKATGTQATALGREAQANGTSSIAIGYSANTATDQATAIGYQASTAGGTAIAIGTQANTTANVATTIGYQAKATGGTAIAIGERASASQYGAIAMGEDANSAGADRSIAIGSPSNATGSAAIAIGANAQAPGGGVISIGYQANAANWESLAVGYQANANQYAAIAVGKSSSALNAYATAIGYQANATGVESTAIGSKANATADDTIAIGYLTNANTYAAIAIGTNTSATANTAIAIGLQTRATAQYATAIGYGVVNDITNSTKLGGMVILSGELNATSHNVTSVNCIVFDSGGKICTGG